MTQHEKVLLLIITPTHISYFPPPFSFFFFSWKEQLHAERMMAFSNCVMFALYVGTIRAGKTFCIAASAACCYLWCFQLHFFTWRRRRRLKKKKTLKRQQHNSTTHTHACTHTLLHGVRVCETRRAYTWTLACIDEVLHYYILKCAHVCVCVRMHHHTVYGHGKRVVTYFGREPASSAHWRLLCRWLLFCGVQSWRFFTFFLSPFLPS